MKKKTVWFFAMLSAAFLAACGGSSQSVEQQEEVVEEDTELTLWTFPVGNWGKPATVANMLADFHKAYPGIHISVEYLNYENGDEKVSQAAASGDLPDLILEGPERLVANWGEEGWMVDLSDLWESERAGAIYENVKEA